MTIGAEQELPAGSPVSRSWLSLSCGTRQHTRHNGTARHGTAWPAEGSSAVGHSLLQAQGSAPQHRYSLYSGDHKRGK